jgi:hypothetical protein
VCQANAALLRRHLPAALFELREVWAGNAHLPSVARLWPVDTVRAVADDLVREKKLRISAAGAAVDCGTGRSGPQQHKRSTESCA